MRKRVIRRAKAKNGLEELAKEKEAILKKARLNQKKESVIVENNMLSKYALISFAVYNLWDPKQNDSVDDKAFVENIINACFHSSC